MRKKKAYFVLTSILLCIWSGHSLGFPGNEQSYYKPLPNLALTLDPQKMEDTYSFNVVSQIFDTLFQLDEFLSIKPNIAHDYKITGGGQIITINLNQNVKFHDGRSLSSDDVIFTLERLIKNASSRYPELFLIKGSNDYIRGRVKNVQGIRKITAWSLEVSLDAPSPTFIMLLTTPSVGILPVSAKERETTFFDKPLGTGPFKIESYEKNRELILVANKDYFLGPPKLEKIIYKYANRQEAIDGFNKGLFHDVQWYNPRPEEIKISHNIVKFPLPRTAILFLNTKKYPFNNKEARKAFIASINKSKLMSECFADKTEAKGFIPFGIGGYERNFQTAPYDVEQAKKMLSSAGFRKPVEINILWMEYHPCNGKFDKLVQEDLAKAGFLPKIRYVTFREFLEANETRDFSAIESIASIDYPEALSLLNYFKSNYKYNLSGFSSSTYDDILKKSLVTVDKYLRYNLYDAAQKILNDEAVILNLYYDVETIIYQKNVMGVVVPSIPFSSLPMYKLSLEN